MKKITIFIICIVTMLNVAARDVNYDVSNIPEALLKDADAVVRNDDNLQTMIDMGNVVYSRSYAVTVLNENGKEFGYVQLAYNKNLKYSKLSIEVLDKNGDRIRKIKKDEIHDVSSISSASLYSDLRVIYSSPEQNEYPYTVKWSYEQRKDGAMSFEDWDFLEGYNISCQSSTYRLLLPKGTEIRYKGVNLNSEPERSVYDDDPSLDSYYWEASNIPVLKYEPYTKNTSEFFPSLTAIPIQFLYAGIVGSHETWNSFGRWQWKLLEGTDVFNPETELEIKSVVKDCSSDEDKVDALYKYMQDKVRYVNLSIGQTGLIPIDAQRVHDVSYGDCKALSNYMRAMLKVVGIQAMYTKVYAGENDRKVDVDFPSQQSNHVILMVPMEKDSIWLECTSQRNPAGYLGSFTEDRTVLFVSEEGGVLGRTPAFSKEDNLVNTKVEIELNEKLDAQIVRDRLYTGVNFGSVYSAYLYRDDDEAKKSIQGSLSLSGFILKSYDYKYELGDDPYISQHIKIEDDHVASVSGSYIMLPLNLVTNNISSLNRVRSRKQELVYRSDKSFCDSVYISIPEGYSIYEMPEKTEIDTEFGVYRSSVEKTEKGVLYSRYYEVCKGVYPASSYRDFYKFFKDMSKASGQNLMLTKG